MNVIDTSMIYPRTSSLVGKEIKELKNNNLPHLKYRCDEERCDFDSVLAKIRTCTELKSVGVKETLQEVVNVISKEQDLFTAKEIDGYVFQTSGKPCLYVEREKEEGENRESLRTGFMDLSESRRRLIHHHELQRLEKQGIHTMAAFGGGTVFGIACVSLLKKFFSP